MGVHDSDALDTLLLEPRNSVIGRGDFVRYEDARWTPLDLVANPSNAIFREVGSAVNAATHAHFLEVGYRRPFFTRVQKAKTVGIESAAQQLRYEPSNPGGCSADNAWLVVNTKRDVGHGQSCGVLEKSRRLYLPKLKRAER